MLKSSHPSHPILLIVTNQEHLKERNFIGEMCVGETDFWRSVKK